MTAQTASDNKPFWGRWAGVYDRFMHGSEGLYAQMAETMKESLTRDMRVLEVACGTGMISRRIAGSVKSLEATDFSPEMIAQARRQTASARLHFSVQDATCLPYADHSFDAVVIVNALHIMPQPERALGELRRVLRPGGLLLAPTFVHGEGVGFRLRARLLALAGFRVYFPWHAQELADFVGRQGFTVLRRRTMGSAIAPLCYLEARSDS